jgi:hypothetical protein
MDQKNLPVSGSAAVRCPRLLPVLIGLWAVMLWAASAEAALELSYASGRTFDAGTAIAAQTPILAGATEVATGYALTAGSVPTGLELDGSTGILSGTPTESGVFTFRITATNGSATASDDATYTVVPVAVSRPTAGANDAPVAMASVATSPAAALPLTVSYTYTPFRIGMAIDTLMPVVGNATAGAAVTFAVVDGKLPDGLQLAGNGAITGTPTVAGTFRSTIKASSAGASGYGDLIMVVIPAPAGPSADRPPFIFEKGGAYGTPWGVPGAWPEQLFWENVAEVENNRGVTLTGAAGLEAEHRAPVMGLVAWGYDLLVANGGNAAYPYDYSARDGYTQYAAWMNPRAEDYFALNPYTGEIAYPHQGYISFGMPMTRADISNGVAAQSFGEWSGERIGKLLLHLDCRGVFAADYFIGMNYNTDAHPELLDKFAAWAGVSIPASAVTDVDRYNFVTRNHGSKWADFVVESQASFFVTIGKTLLAGGKTPFLSGQIHFEPGVLRGSGVDPRVWYERLPGDYWFFVVETQAGDGRGTSSYWTSLYGIGATACREPRVRIGSMLSADDQYFWPVATSNGWSDEVGRLYLKHDWLSAGWTYIATVDGSVRRAAQAFQRSYWDDGSTTPAHIDTLLGHIPRHPFGPALYYSVNVEKSFESPRAATDPEDTPNYYYFYEYLQRGISNPKTSLRQGADAYYGLQQGLNLGYWVGDRVDPSALPKANRPSAWLLYNTGRLPAAERAKLEAVAPVYDLMKSADAAAALASSPVYATGLGLNLIAFVDQNDSVVIMVSNIESSAVSGTLEFSDVHDGVFPCNGLLGTPSGVLTISGHTGRLAITVPAYDTIVYEIPKLQWIDHTTIPTRPTGLTVSVDSATNLALSWTASVDDVAVTGYRIYRDDVPVGTSNTCAFTDTGLTAATSYTYTVVAIDGDGHESAKAGAVSATTKVASSGGESGGTPTSGGTNGSGTTGGSTTAGGSTSSGGSSSGSGSTGSGGTSSGGGGVIGGDLAGLLAAVALLRLFARRKIASA